MELLDSEGGHETFYFKLETPKLMKNRKAFVTKYVVDKTAEGGSYTYCWSGKGNDEYFTKYKDKVNKGVHANMIINLSRFEQAEGGLNQVSVMCVDPAGSIPEFLKKWIAKKQINQPITLRNFVLGLKVDTEEDLDEDAKE